MPRPNPEFDAARHAALYVAQDSSQIEPAATAAAIEMQWKDWRAAMRAAITGKQPSVTPAKGDIRLQAKDATVHGTTLRYEAEPYKNVLGYWTDVSDWAEWKFNIAEPGAYEVEIQQGCGAGSGGAEVDVEVGGQSLKFTVQDTGHFQSMILRTIGKVQLSTGEQRLAIKPRSRPGRAVMDVRRVVLRPAP
jgi:hypothetical protein